ncbi:hypothetical protein ACFFX0_01455 [Citricoccus parietis]|uniref:Uncharacterized protein n=1 Tax=Citricoccus parietis TaxID=592307 RepID=A0ABV5FTC9_9MICC
MPDRLSGAANSRCSQCETKGVPIDTSQFHIILDRNRAAADPAVPDATSGRGAERAGIAGSRPRTGS